jgi:hypothetical protein
MYQHLKRLLQKSLSLYVITLWARFKNLSALLEDPFRIL